MRVLLDTNIIIHREGNRVIRPEIGTVFNWLDRLHYEKCIHPLTIGEIEKHQDPQVVATFKAKMSSYHVLSVEASETPEIQAIRVKYDKTLNDSVDTSLLKEVFAERVDLLLSEDALIHKKAKELGVAARVLRIEAFLEQVVAQNPDLVAYKVLSVKKERFGNIPIRDPFFDSFRQDYPDFDKWFNKKAEEVAYISTGESGEILAFLYVKVETQDENYSDVHPTFARKRRLKIGTFKVISNGFRLGERFLKIVFDNALQYGVDEIYVTIFNRTPEQERLIELMEKWGFGYHGVKTSGGGEEKVFVRDFKPNFSREDPRVTYPFVARSARKFIVPIYPEYHTELFPDSILRTEDPLDFVENRPNRNAISKIYISRSYERDLMPGDIVVFYRTGDKISPAHYSAVATTLGVVQKKVDAIRTLSEFTELCQRRSVFTDAELAKHWNYRPNDRPFVVNFLYVHSFPKRLNLSTLKHLGVISEAPRGFMRLSDVAFEVLLEHSDADQRFIVD